MNSPLHQNCKQSRYQKMKMIKKIVKMLVRSCSSSLWPNVSKVTSLWGHSVMTKVKVPSVSQWLSQWQGHLLSCSGQLKTMVLWLFAFQPGGGFWSILRGEGVPIACSRTKSMPQFSLYKWSFGQTLPHIRAYILKGGFRGCKTPQTIWIFRRKIVWEREKYQDYTVCRAIDGHFPYLCPVLENCQ